MSDIFKGPNYRATLKQALLAKKTQFGRQFTFAKMAKACRLQRAYLSTVLGGEGHLNSDQVYIACQFLQFDEDEYRFTSLLHEFERSVFPERKKFLQLEIDKMRSQSLKTERYLDGTPLLTEDAVALREFFLDIHAQFILMFFTIERFRTDPAAIMRVLGICPEIFQQALLKAERAGLVRIKDGYSVEILQDIFHLPANSPFYPWHTVQMRLKAIEHLQKQCGEKQYSFSVLYTADEASRQNIVANFLKFVAKAQAETQTEVPKHVYQLNFDLLRWSPD